MPNICNAVKTGNASDATVWDTVPQSGDTVRCGAYVVTIDLDWDLGTGTLERNGSGYFKVTSAHTLTLNISSISGAVGGNTCVLACSHSTGTVTINGNVHAGSANTAHGITNSGAGSLVVNGIVTGGYAGDNYAYGIWVTGTGAITVTEARGGAGEWCLGINIIAAAVVTVNKATGGGGSNAHGVNASGSHLYVDTATGGSVADAHGVNAGGNIDVQTAVGGSIAGAYGIKTAKGTVHVTTAIGSATSHGVYVAGNGCVIDDAYPNNYGNGTVTTLGYGVATAHNVTAYVKRVHCSQYGVWPIAGRVYMNPETYPDYYVQTYQSSGDPHTLIEANGFVDFPAESDVRYGVPFDHGDHCGTCHVPAPEYVEHGIPIDDTTGTALLLPEAAADAVWDEARADHTTTGTFGKVSEWAGGSGGGGDPSAIADAVWDEARSEHTTTGTFGDVATWAAGYGPLRLIVHVTDGGADLSGAGVIVAVGSGLTARYVQTTDPDGRASFFVPYGLSSVTVWKSGYLSYSTSVIMDADRLMEVQLQQLVIPSSGDPEQTSAWLYTYDGAGNVAEGAVITFVLAAPPDGTGSSYATDEFTATSDENGLVTVNLRCGATYIAKRGNGRWVSFTTGTDPTYELPQVLGRDSA